MPFTTLQNLTSTLTFPERVVVPIFSMKYLILLISNSNLQRKDCLDVFLTTIALNPLSHLSYKQKQSAEKILDLPQVFGPKTPYTPSILVKSITLSSP